VTAFSDAPSQLRGLLGERVADDTSVTFFTNEEIDGLLAMADQNLNLAALYGWTMKASELSRQIDIDESGASRKLSQRYRAAQQQMNFFRDRVAEDQAIAVAAGRVGPKIIDLRDCGDRAGLVLYTPGHRFRTVFG
jgi:hypothetical protein